MTTVAEASPEAADKHYARAIELVREKRLTEAKVEFEAAYRESPHFAVLYNLGRVSLELGQHAEARDYLRRCLELGATTMSNAQRTDVQSLLDRAEEHLQSAASARPKVAVATPEPTASHSPPDLRVPSAVATPPSVGAPRAASAPPSRVIGADSRDLSWTFALGGAGVSALLVAGTLFVWNADAYADAQTVRDRLRQTPAPDAVSVGDAAAFESALAQERALAENQADFRAVRRMDSVVAVTAAVGAAFVVAGVVFYLSSPRRAVALTTIRPPSLRLSF